MSRNILVITALMLLVLTLPGISTAKLKVVATLNDLGWIAEQVGGDDVEVSVLCPPHQDPHYLPAKPSLAKKLKKADLLLYNGLELEIGWLPLLIETARNPKIKPGSRGELECADALEHILDVPTGHVDRSKGDIHPLGNPHFLLDPRNGVKVALLIAERMSELDIDAAERYKQRADMFQASVEKRLPEWEALLSASRNCPVIVYHQHWEYLLNWLDIQTIGSIEHRPGISPSPRHTKDIINLGRSQKCVYIIAATWDNLKIAKKASERMDAPLIILPGATGAMEGAEGYLGLFDYICKELSRGGVDGVRNE
ncbi:MAG: zinc ABC transporter substrate-binding protein [Candidatus Electryonea clarkiae]|nr:zinc ABC transporter substrate-binding protein [Candidatus Electryonea clarkiae]MDP8288305.1 zinc ABC transporter substrate-binding protein [Candidatus Electryonea clarkiae]